jgi:hypothetical protein
MHDRSGVVFFVGGFFVVFVFVVAFPISAFEAFREEGLGHLGSGGFLVAARFEKLDELFVAGFSCIVGILRVRLRTLERVIENAHHAVELVRRSLAAVFGAHISRRGVTGLLGRALVPSAFAQRFSSRCHRIFLSPNVGSAGSALLRGVSVATAARLVFVLSFVTAWLFALPLLFTLFVRTVRFLLVVHEVQPFVGIEAACNARAGT